MNVDMGPLDQDGLHSCKSPETEVPGKFTADLLWTSLDCGIGDWEQYFPEFKDEGSPSWQLGYKDPCKRACLRRGPKA